jgi:tetratricopeptide (TPR) repeat protein
LSALYSAVGQYDKALETTKVALEIDPASGIDYSNLVNEYTAGLKRQNPLRRTPKVATWTLPGFIYISMSLGFCNTTVQR